MLGFSGTVCGSAINRNTYMASFTAWIRAIYLASVEDRAMVCCLLLDHDTGDHLDSCWGDLSFIRMYTYVPVLLQVSK